MPNVDGGKTVQQAVNMAPLGWVPPDRGTGDQGSNRTSVPGEGGNRGPNRNPADDPAPSDGRLPRYTFVRRLISGSQCSPLMSPSAHMHVMVWLGALYGKNSSMPLLPSLDKAASRKSARLEKVAPPSKEGAIEPQHRHNPQETGTFAPYQPATATSDEAQRNAWKWAPAAGCGGVAASHPPPWIGAGTAGRIAGANFSLLCPTAN